MAAKANSLRNASGVSLISGTNGPSIAAVPNPATFASRRICTFSGTDEARSSLSVAWAVRGATLGPAGSERKPTKDVSTCD